MRRLLSRHRQDSWRCLRTREKLMKCCDERQQHHQATQPKKAPASALCVCRRTRPPNCCFASKRVLVAMQRLSKRRVFLECKLLSKLPQQLAQDQGGSCKGDDDYGGERAYYKATRQGTGETVSSCCEALPWVTHALHLEPAERLTSLVITRLLM